MTVLLTELTIPLDYRLNQVLSERGFPKLSNLDQVGVVECRGTNDGLDNAICELGDSPLVCPEVGDVQDNNQ